MAARLLSEPTRLLFALLLAVSTLLSQGNGIAAQEDVGTPQASPEASGATQTTILLGETIAVEGEGAAVGDRGVTITSGGVFTINGTLADGMIDVYAPGSAVELVLAGVSITNSDGPAIMVSDATATTITLEAGTSNMLTDGGDTEFDAALFSAPSLTIRGEGELTVDGNQEEGIESTMRIIIESGTIRVYAFEDGLNANTDDVSEIHINGGYLFVETETGDGIDSNGSLTITDGTVISLGAIVDANGGLDADGPVTIDGGTVIATGARNATPVAASAQRSIQVAFDRAQAADTLIVIRDEAGEDVLAFAPSIDFQQLLYSNASIADGVTYTVFSGGTAEGEAIDGLYSTPVADPGTEVTTVTTASIQDAQRGRSGRGGSPPAEGGSPPSAPPSGSPSPADSGTGG